MATSRPRLAEYLKPGDLAAYDRFVDNMLSHLVASRHIYRMVEREKQ